MAVYIRCKACGYIMDEAHLKEVCPACGIGKAVFEPYTKVISPKRKLLLDQHIHPVTVHFPQVMLVLCVFMPLLSMVVQQSVRLEFLVITKWAIYALPITVFGGFVTGLLDGKLRFKKLTTPLLINKIIAGVALQVVALAIFLVYFFWGLTDSTLWLIVGLGAIATVVAIYLGKAGASMFNSILPG